MCCKLFGAGAGGYALPLLQKTGIEEVRGFMGFPRLGNVELLTKAVRRGLVESSWCAKIQSLGVRDTWHIRVRSRDTYDIYGFSVLLA